MSACKTRYPRCPRCGQKCKRLNRHRGEGMCTSCRDRLNLKDRRNAEAIMAAFTKSLAPLGMNQADPAVSGKKE